MIVKGEAWECLIQEEGPNAPVNLPVPGALQIPLRSKVALSADEAQCMSETFFHSEIDRLCRQARAGSDDS